MSWSTQAPRVGPVQTTFSDDYPQTGIKYTVQQGDSIATIAKKTGAKEQDIINANKIADRNRIQLGQTLKEPNAAAQTRPSDV